MNCPRCGPPARLAFSTKIGSIEYRFCRNCGLRRENCGVVEVIHTPETLTLMSPLLGLSRDVLALDTAPAHALAHDIECLKSQLRALRPPLEAK